MQNHNLIKYIKIFIITLITIISFIGIVYLNIINEQQHILLENNIIQVNTEYPLVDKIANIIKRDGINISSKRSTEYAQYILNAGLKYSVDPTLILSVMFVESRFNHNAYSDSGAIGIMQIIPSYHKEKLVKSNLLNAKDNIHIGTRILKEYDIMSKSTVDALLRYNGTLGKSPYYANKVLKVKQKYDYEVYRKI